jgi:hypothetical protein
MRGANGHRDILSPQKIKREKEKRTKGAGEKAEGKQGKRQTSHGALQNSEQTKKWAKKRPSSSLPRKLKSHAPIKREIAHLLRCFCVIFRTHIKKIQIYVLGDDKKRIPPLLRSISECAYAQHQFCCTFFIFHTHTHTPAEPWTASAAPAADAASNHSNICRATRGASKGGRAVMTK